MEVNRALGASEDVADLPGRFTSARPIQAFQLARGQIVVARVVRLPTPAQAGNQVRHEHEQQSRSRVSETVILVNTGAVECDA
ncbi:hypothetical protein ALQ25_200142 [Pseudomonas coronafaciens pv. atropurpurea]|nr:hypothetical protein ALQ25_200142 [Pseudomonas coronafaciens pv. atropurpurea]